MEEDSMGVLKALEQIAVAGEGISYLGCHPNWKKSENNT
jgi:hypothetical protein